MEIGKPWRCEVGIIRLGPGQIQVCWPGTHGYRYAGAGGRCVDVLATNIQDSALPSLDDRYLTLLAQDKRQYERALVYVTRVSQTMFQSEVGGNVVRCVV